MTDAVWTSRRVLVTGADGFLGRGVVAALAREGVQTLVAADVREVPAERRLPGVTYLVQDVRDPTLVQTLADHAIDSVVHLASIVTPGKGSNREFEYSVDVLGSKNVLDACVVAGVKHIVVSSSGAAYGYHADNPAWLRETDALRGNEVFAYSHHKRLVEEMLAEYRAAHPALAQTVLRIGTILGERVDNQITALFDKPRLLAIRGSESPFVFIWDDDVTGAIMHALRTQCAGCFNLAGDGALPLREIARRLGKPLLALPAGLLRAALAVGSTLGVSRYGPEQLDFLRYRPVLLNTALKDGLGYVPGKTSAEAFDAFVAARARQGRPVAAAVRAVSA
ncbi:MAG: NAD-dependent epimerase/dehydratase family protein [Gammaproteobacteria bacterium]|nr:NAD-dependent epimerase/dehydratase family protein [Gammaproteobacteria bacterium]MBU1508140.1 NAD-dependent epimerase/dehydratase family protein [Gammaproteobacteria bacterium]MBU2120703.1 NAD-dependent epimerase/dehydratase family protein [Gammaproteobacteria bacterium]MBU2169460.1 NAD-dependent epimerase/dehydratase family protein [Gammaproteobacteria bacterium]MBU2200460.1 NAD-dependent epimerase/dehydratase family protein [Gammaproteobacteria bacterium]